MTGERVDGRVVLAIGGADRTEFLQGLVTNDVTRLSSGLVYAALLSPQGKYLADFFLKTRPDCILLDVAEELAPALYKRLHMYRLRADVTIAQSDVEVTRGLGPVPEGADPDPRDPGLGWRGYGLEPGGDPAVDWDSLRVQLGIPESGVELIPDDSYILEAGFERLNGVDFRKGCYVGQEVTARMKHKTSLRKGLTRVRIDGTAPVGTPLMADTKKVGTLFTQSGDTALAHLRFDQAQGELLAGTAKVSIID